MITLNCKKLTCYVENVEGTKGEYICELAEHGEIPKEDFKSFCEVCTGTQRL